MGSKGHRGIQTGSEHHIVRDGIANPLNHRVQDDASILLDDFAGPGDLRVDLDQRSGSQQGGVESRPTSQRPGIVVEQFDDLVGHGRAVLNGVGSSLEGPQHPLRALGVGSDEHARRVGLLADCCHFLGSHLWTPGLPDGLRIGDTAGRGDLDGGCPQTQVLTHRLASLPGSIDDPRDAQLSTVAARDGQQRARRHDARAEPLSGLALAAQGDGLVVILTEAANGGHAGIELGVCKSPCTFAQHGTPQRSSPEPHDPPRERRVRQRFGQRTSVSHEVSMGIDEPRHDPFARAVNNAEPSLLDQRAAGRARRPRSNRLRQRARCDRPARFHLGRMSGHWPRSELRSWSSSSSPRRTTLTPAFPGMPKIGQ